MNWRIRVWRWSDWNGTPARLECLPPSKVYGEIIGELRDDAHGEPTYTVRFPPPWGTLQVRECDIARSPDERK